MIPRSPWIFLVAAGLAVGCDKKDPSPAPSTTPSSSAPATSTLPIASAPKPAPWFEGKWQGTYDAEQYAIETPEKNTGAREWESDDGGEHSGEGSIEISVTTDGQISGTAKGPLGDQKVSGQVDEKQFRIRFSPVEPGERAFGGAVVLEQQGEAMKGRLSSSSGDSKTVRDAAIVLTKAGGKPDPGH